MYWQCRHCQYILVHNFLDIWLIFNLFEVLESSASGLFNCIDSVDIHSIECIIFCIECHNLYRQCQHTCQSQLCKTFCRLKIGWILRKLWAEMCGCSIECIRNTYALYPQCQHWYLRPLYTEKSRVFTPHSTLYKVLCKSHKHQYQQSRHSIAFNALHALIFILTVSTNKIPYSIHNSIALILCIDHLNMPFTVMYIQTTM